MIHIFQIYDGTSLKLNQVIDIIGFISLDPTLYTNQDSEDDAEMMTHYPPTSLVPRLHAVKIIKLTKPDIPNAPEIVSKAEIIREDLHMILSQLLFGDRLAADYLICHLLSTMYVSFIRASSLRREFTRRFTILWHFQIFEERLFLSWHISAKHNEFSGQQTHDVSERVL